MRLPIRRVVWPLLLVASATSATAWLAAGDVDAGAPPPARGSTSPAGTSTAAAAPDAPGAPGAEDADDTDDAVARVRAADVDGLLALTAGPDAQARAMAIAALARHPDDARARAALVAACAASRPREERLLALTVMASMAERGWARPALEAAARDVDAQVRAAAESLLRQGPGARVGE